MWCSFPFFTFLTRAFLFGIVALPPWSPLPGPTPDAEKRRRSPTERLADAGRRERERERDNVYIHIYIYIYIYIHNLYRAWTASPRVGFSAGRRRGGPARSGRAVSPSWQTGPRPSAESHRGFKLSSSSNFPQISTPKRKALAPQALEARVLASAGCSFQGHPFLKEINIDKRSHIIIGFIL